MLDILSPIVPIFIVAASGYGLRQYTALDGQTLSTLNVYLLMPVLVFDSLAEHHIEWDVYGRYVVASVLMLAIMGCVLGLITRLRRMKGAMYSAFMMTLFMNLGNFGLPVSKFAFGDEGLALAVIVMVACTFFQNAFGLFFAHQGSHGTAKAMLQVLRFPLIYAFILALVFQYMEWELPVMLGRAVSLTAGATIPMQLLILGICIAETRLETGPDVFIASGARLVIGPVAGMGAAWLAGLEGLTAQVFILQMSGPVAVTMAVYAVQFNVRPAYLASVVTWTFLLSFVSVSAVLWVLFRFY
ncbi:MAG: AEC family transporter [Candidatus Hydrogenedentota bacterium]